MSEQKQWWACSGCGYLLHAEEPPKICPGCHRCCYFLNATCYIPECGGPDYPDPRIVESRPRAINE